MKQAHTEQTVAHSDGEQNTGNHRHPKAEDKGGVDAHGGTRHGAEHLEPPATKESEAGPS